jgi:hypothetical protein
VDLGAAAGVDVERLRLYCREALAFARRVPCASCESTAHASLVLVDACDDLGGHVAAARRAVTLSNGRETLHLFGQSRRAHRRARSRRRWHTRRPPRRWTHALQERTRYRQCLPARRCALASGIALARGALGADEFNRLWSLGHRLGYDELVAAALDEKEMPL